MALLEGKRINKRYTYRSCFLLAKYFKSLGYDYTKIRKEIIQWAKNNDLYITDDLNSIIQKAFKDRKELVDNVEIKISDNDIKEIVDRFDRYNTRLTAFAMLCIAKKFANENGMFYMSMVGLSNWIEIDRAHLFNRHMEEIIDFGYVERVKNDNLYFIKSRGKFISQVATYKIKVNYKNIGEYIVKDSNIREEFENILADCEY